MKPDDIDLPIDVVDPEADLNGLFFWPVLLGFLLGVLFVVFLFFCWVVLR